MEQGDVFISSSSSSSLGSKHTLFPMRPRLLSDDKITKKFPQVHTQLECSFQSDMKIKLPHFTWHMEATLKTRQFKASLSINSEYLMNTNGSRNTSGNVGQECAAGLRRATVGGGESM